MDVKAYIESDVLESYVLSSTSGDENHELLQLEKKYSEITDAIFELETDLEHIARYMAIIPPPDMFARIENKIVD